MGAYGGLLALLGTYGGLWGPIGTYGDLWRPMGAYGDLWGPMGAYGGLWGPVEISGSLRGPMGTHGGLWGPMGTHGGLWGPVGTYGDLWEPMGACGGLWGPMRAYGDSLTSMGTFGDPLAPTGTYGGHGHLWKPMGTYRDLWGPMGAFGDPLAPMGTYGDLSGPMGTYGVGGITFLHPHLDTNPPVPPAPSIRSILDISHILVYTLQKQHAISDIGHQTLYTILVVRTVHMKLDLARLQHRVVDVLITNLATFFDVIAEDVHLIVAVRVGPGEANHLATHTEGFSYTLPWGPWPSSTLAQLSGIPQGTIQGVHASGAAAVPFLRFMDIAYRASAVHPFRFPGLMWVDDTIVILERGDTRPIQGVPLDQRIYY